LPKSITQTFDFVLVPVITDDAVIALMRLSRPSKKPFTADELRFLEAVANQTALALERVKLIAFLENLSITDALTGIANRRHFEWRLSEEIERARRYKYPLSALMLDLDHFKQVNDNYGHQIGDIVLQQVAQRLRRILRRTDFLARYGGEEFIVLAPQTPADRALILAERLRQVIAESPIPVADNLQIHITISIGVAVFPNHAQNESELIGAADAALYKAKQMGRNRVCMFEPELVKGGGKNVRA
jgi:diguanylate cyclase (GGDEF) domain